MLRRWRTQAGAVSIILPVVLAAGCKANGVTNTSDHGGGSSSSTASGSRLPVDNPDAPMPSPGTCKVGSRDGQPLPDPDCTPGAINPDVKQSNIDQTICKVGWTKTVRPPTSKTNAMKAKSARSYSLSRSATGEYDHLIPLELGGAPDDPRNLWVEPGHIPNPKDAVEHKLNDAVCSGLVPLAKAQKAMAARWVTAYDDVGLRVSGGKVCLRDDPSKCAKGRHGGSAGD
ncbi:hypothetical protein [Actinoallomurus rhizosphaericola]|uniref:hypothetical protein n=1 Tax=Actinoallomurus rhizosphaericola TaxID=2952536 RepID=UPI002091A6ED|nr:hypothetical protein [Actinoallomurus rhizosphaericola]MCO5994722.1 hypothetical protein [Actinoallomurus rhizosphaericola]